MKYILIVIISFIPFFCFPQGTAIEEKALDFYLKNIYEKGSKLRSTGKFETQKNPFIGGDIISDYLNCKKNRAKDTAEANFYRKSYVHLIEKYKASEANIPKIDSAEISTLEVNLRDPIKKVEKLKYHRLRGGPIGLFRKVTSKIFGEPFNMYLYRHIESEGSYYTCIAVTKKDAEYSLDYWFKLSKEEKVIDWCQGGWIQ